MKKILLSFFILTALCINSCNANEFSSLKTDFFNRDLRGIKSTLNSQVKYANHTNLKKFVSTYDAGYKNSDGYDLTTYTALVEDLWKNYDKIKYGIKIKDIEVKDNIAKVSLVETSKANISATKSMLGVLKSEADSIYYLKKTNGKWKVISDKIIDEQTSMLYGLAAATDIKLSAPKVVDPNYEYTASLEFETPKDVFAIASIAKDKVEYPQKQAKEVFRKMPEDNILERLFISNSDKCNEYVVASIGLTKADVDNLNIKISLVGFGYKIIRVNVKGAGYDAEKALYSNPTGDSDAKKE